jgi:acyl-CoA synthetase (AMP-forming)/AMP-acid ligase II
VSAQPFSTIAAGFRVWATAFVPDGWFRAAAKGSLDPDDYLSLTGHLQEMINRRGEKISPVEVDRVLRTHQAVSEAAVFGVPDARPGEDVAAEVLKPGVAATPRELRRWAEERR